MLRDRLGNEIKEGMLALIDGAILSQKMIDGVVTFAQTSGIVPNGQMPCKRLSVMIQIDIKIGPQPGPGGRMVMPEVFSGVIVMPCPENYPIAVALGMNQVEKKEEKSPLIT